MPILGSLLGVLMVWLCQQLMRFFSIERAWKIASASVLLGLVLVMFTAAFSCARGVCASAIGSMGSSHPAFGVGLGAAFNSTTTAAAGCYMTVWLLCQTYVMKKKMIDILK